MHTIDEVYAHIDWLTLTVPEPREDYQDTVHAWTEIVRREQDAGAILRPATLNGYAGVQAGQAFVGTRPDGAMIQLSGGAADTYLMAAHRAGVAVPRIDLAVTVRYREMHLLIAEGAYLHAMATNSKRPVQTRRKLSIIHNSEGSDTTYIGAPSSAQRGRIYNKDKQSGDEAWRNCWRWEVQFRNPLAAQAAAQVVSRGTLDRNVVQGLVADWFEVRGVTLDVGAPAAPAALPATFRERSDTERQLTWLRTQVAPTVRRLIETGLYNEAIQALGLD